MGTIIASLYALASAILLGYDAVDAFTTNEVLSDADESSLTSVNIEVSFPYVFAEPHSVEASDPIIEHISAETISDFNQDRPAFLYDDHQPNRLVLYYGDWCDTINEFKPRFVQWSKNLQATAETHGEFVMIYVVSCRPNVQLCMDQAVNEFPLARVYGKDSTSGHDITYKNLTIANVFEKLGFQFPVERDENPWISKVGNTGTAVTKDVSQAFLLQKFVRYESSGSTMQRRRSLADDIHLSLDFVLRHTLFSEKKPMERTRKRHLNKFLKLISRTLPEKWPLHELLKDLLKDYNYCTDSSSYMTRVLDRHPPQRTKWSESCSRGVPGKGLSCGLWKLFHVISVGLVRFNTESKEDRRLSAKDAASTIRDFLGENFRCADCRDNFLHSYDRCEYGRCHLLSDATKGSAKNLIGPWAQLSIWLVQWHNGVNKMVLERKAQESGKNVTLSDQLDVIWPPRSECLPCWEKSDGTTLPKLNPTMTFNWLKAEYGPNDQEVRKAEKYIKKLHRQQVRTENRPKRMIQIAQSTIAILLVAVALKRSTRKSVYIAGKKEDDGAN